MSERTVIPAVVPWVDLANTPALRGTLSPVIDPVAAAKAARAAEPLLEELNRNPAPTQQGTGTPQPPGTAPKLELSVMARQLAQLLSSDTPVEPAATSVRPLLPAPEAKPDKIAAALQQQITHSGLFYESHLGEWVEGKRGLESLRLEPQAQFTRPVVEQPAKAGAQSGGPMPDARQANAPTALARAAGANLDSAAANIAAERGRAVLPGDVQTPLMQRLSEPTMDLYAPTGKLSQPLRPESQERTDMTAPLPRVAGQGETERAAGTSAGAMAERGSDAMRSDTASAPARAADDLGIDTKATALVRQQLDLLDTQQVQWRGELWPGLPIALQIEQDARQQRHGERAAPDELPVWRTVLVSTLPRLGEVTLKISLTGDRLQLVTRAPSDEAAALLSRHVPELERALKRAGISLASVAHNGRPAE